MRLAADPPERAPGVVRQPFQIDHLFSPRAKRQERARLTDARSSAHDAHARRGKPTHGPAPLERPLSKAFVPSVHHAHALPRQSLRQQPPHARTSHTTAKTHHVHVRARLSIALTRRSGRRRARLRRRAHDILQSRRHRVHPRHHRLTAPFRLIQQPHARSNIVLKQRHVHRSRNASPLVLHRRPHVHQRRAPARSRRRRRRRHVHALDRARRRGERGELFHGRRVARLLARDALERLPGRRRRHDGDRASARRRRSRARLSRDVTRESEDARADASNARESGRRARERDESSEGDVPRRVEL